MTSKKAASLSSSLFAAKGSAAPAVDERYLVDAREVRSPKILTGPSPRPVAVAEPRVTEIAEFSVVETTKLEPVLTLDETVVYMPADAYPGVRQRHLRVACSIAAVAVLSVGLWFASSALVGSTDKGAPVESQGGATLSLQPASAAPVGPSGAMQTGTRLAATAAVGAGGGMMSPAAAAALPVAPVELPPLPAGKPTLSTLPAGDGDYVIQLSSVGSAAAAKREWIRFRESYPDLLSDLKFAAQRTALRNRGTVYGVQTGPFADLGSARQACELLQAKNQDCLVIKR